MKTKLLLAIGLAVACSFASAGAQAPMAPEVKKAPAPQIEIVGQFFTVAQSAAERLGLIYSSSGGAPAWRGKLSKADSEKLFAVLAKEKSMTMLSVPRVTTKSGQRAVIEIIREFRYPTEIEPNKDGILAPTKFETRNVGLAMEISPTLSEGGLIDLEAVPRCTGFRGFVGYSAGKTAKSAPIPKDGFTQPIFDNTEYALNATVRPEQSLLLGGFQ